MKKNRKKFISRQNKIEDDSRLVRFALFICQSCKMSSKFCSLLQNSEKIKTKIYNGNKVETKISFAHPSCSSSPIIK